MKSALAFIVAMVMVLEVRAFDAEVNFTCAAGPVYTFEVTGGAVGGWIFIANQCAPQDFTSENQTFTFNATYCNGSVPNIGTSFDVFILENADYETVSDKRFRSKCTKDLTTKIQSVSFRDVSPDTDLDYKNGSLSPKFTMTILNNDTDTEINYGKVGDQVRIKIQLVTEQKDYFGFRVEQVNSSTANLFDERGCINSDLSSIIKNQPELPDEGTVYVYFHLFRPVSSESTAPSTLTLDVTLKVCNSTCGPYKCTAGRRRRRDDGLDSGDDPYTPVTMSTSILVLPTDYESTKKTEVDYENDVSFARSPMLGLMLGLSIALVVCISVSTLLFCKLRKSGGRLNAKEAYSNNGFKA